MNDRELRRNLSVIIRDKVRTEVAIPEGMYFPSSAFDTAADAVVRYLRTQGWLYRAKGWAVLGIVLLIALAVRGVTGEWPR